MGSFGTQMITLIKSFEEIENSNLSEDTKILFSNLAVTRLVTLIECYYRDSLDAIFRLCKHTAYLPSIDKIIKAKYSVREILDLELQGLHFLETIPRQLSFQNIGQICSVYDHYFEKGFRKEIQENQFRFKDHPEHIMEVTDPTFSTIENLFELRHEIIHNPGMTIRESKQDISSYLEQVWNLVFCSDQAIINFMETHVKEEVKLA